MNKSLTNKRKAEILKDFEEWSGGYHPNEVHWLQEDENDEPGKSFWIEDNAIDKEEAKLIREWFHEMDN